MASLRARLVAGLLALAAAGMLILAGITYAEQHNFLYDRIDNQVQHAPQAVANKLSHGFGQYDGDDHGRPPGPGRDDPGGLPAGTYGQLRLNDGRVVSGYLVDYGQTSSSSKPKLPSRIPLDRQFTVDGTGDTKYRVYAQSDPAGNVAVAAAPLTEVTQTLNRLLLVEALVIAGVLAILGLAAWYVVRIGLLPLNRMAHTAGAIAGGDLSHRVESTDPRTEVGRLGLALNAMLDRLEHAFAERQASEDRLRQFIADASHELRTPLTSIRGYAELFRSGAASDPADTEKAMRRIEDEAARMGVLVEDLLMLARLDEVAELPHVDVDLESLACDAVDDARATAPNRAIDVEVEAPAVVVGEAHQLRQVLANLLRNALVHTPDGTPIEVTVAHEGDDVRLEVRDHGPGLPTDDSDALFERFWRAEGGRERGKGGAGLGLAIVAAIVDAHDGRVQASNAPGGGACFVVRLPAAARPAAV
jgi:two-component system, OmpR family, sensor kinase